MNKKIKLGEIINQDKAKSILYQMLFIREFEQACAEQYELGKIRGFLHLSIGQEAIAATIISLLNDDDQIFATYREHGHAIARGIDEKKMMAEMFGKVTGTSKGRGGSMHIFDLTKNFYGGNAIVAGHIPLSVGMGLANKVQKNNKIVVCFFGEGAVAEGEFHESLNLAALWEIPILFICENNYYAMGTSIERSQSQVNISLKAHAYNIEAQRVFAMSVSQIYKNAQFAIEYVREQKRPFFLECDTYRFRAHSMFDPEEYRSKEEVEKWKHSDPITLFIHQLKQYDWITQHDIQKIQKDIEKKIAMAIEFAEKSEFEKLEDCLKEVI